MYYLRPGRRSRCAIRGLPDQRIPLELFETADVSVALSLAMTVLFLAVCLATVG
jgi:hypothetical protein